MQKQCAVSHQQRQRKSIKFSVSPKIFIQPLSVIRHLLWGILLFYFFLYFWFFLSHFLGFFFIFLFVSKYTFSSLPVWSVSSRKPVHCFFDYSYSCKVKVLISFACYANWITKGQKRT